MTSMKMMSFTKGMYYHAVQIVTLPDSGVYWAMSEDGVVTLEGHIGHI